MHNIIYSYEVDFIESLTHDISRILLRPTTLQRINYVAGQYVKIIQDKTSSPMSIACAPNEKGLLEFHLYHPEQNRAANALLKKAKQQNEWQLTGPYGTCTVNRLVPNKSIIFLARGIGFAPVKAVIESLTQARQYPPMQLYWRMPTHDDFYLQDLLKKWQDHLSSFRYSLVVFKEENTKERIKFDLLQKTILQNHPNLQNFQVYASGPSNLIYAVVATFEEHGLPREYFYSDVFG